MGFNSGFKGLIEISWAYLGMKQDRQCTRKFNIEAPSYNHFSRGKAISISYSECVSVALVIQQAMRMRRFTLSHKGDNIRGEKKLLNINCVF
jgi:hypothetical protein